MLRRPLQIEDMPILPEFAEVFRASGECHCEVCGDLYRRHERYAYPSLLGSVVKGCDGRFYHL